MMGNIERILNTQESRNSALRSKINDGINILFYGCGEVAKSCLRELRLVDFDKVKRKINSTFLVATNESYNDREVFARQLMQAQQSHGSNKFSVSAEYKTSLENILPKIDLLIFTADKNSSLKNREELCRNNIELVDELFKYMPEGFSGLINFVSNIPEILAYHTAAKYGINPFQITAGTPLEIFRYGWLVEKYLEGMNIEWTDLTVVGYHDLGHPVRRGAKANRGMYQKVNGNLKPHMEPIDQLMKNRRWFDDELIYQFQECGPNEYKMVENAMKAKNMTMSDSKGSCTSFVTGVALKDYILAILDDKKTSTAIPFNGFNSDEWFYVYLPIKFSGLVPQIDVEKFKHLSQKDFQILNEYILGTGKYGKKDRISLKTMQSRIIKDNLLIEDPEQALREYAQKVENSKSNSSNIGYKNKKWSDITTFNTIYDDEIALLNNVPKDLGVTGYEHLKKISNGRKKMLEFSINHEYLDKGVKRKMEQLDDKLKKMKNEDFDNIKEILLGTEKWNEIWIELNKGGSRQEWSEYMPKWIAMGFGSDEMKQLQKNPKYKNAVKIQQEYHLLIGQATEKLEKHFGSVIRVQEALALYKQVVDLWPDIIK